MDHVRTTPCGVEVASRIGWGTRGALLLFGLAPLLAPYELLVVPRWSTSAGLALLVPLIISAGALALSGALLALAIAGRSRHIVFDRAHRVIAMRAVAAFGRGRRTQIPFVDVEEIGVVASAWESGPDTYDIELAIRGQRPLRFGGFTTREGASRALTEVREALGR